MAPRWAVPRRHSGPGFELIQYSSMDSGGTPRDVLFYDYVITALLALAGRDTAVMEYRRKVERSRDRAASFGNRRFIYEWLTTGTGLRPTGPSHGPPRVGPQRRRRGPAAGFTILSKVAFTRSDARSLVRSTSALASGPSFPQAGRDSWPTGTPTPTSRSCSDSRTTARRPGAFGCSTAGDVVAVTTKRSLRWRDANPRTRSIHPARRRRRVTEPDSGLRSSTRPLLDVQPVSAGNRKLGRLARVRRQRPACSDLLRSCGSGDEACRRPARAPVVQGCVCLCWVCGLRLLLRPQTRFSVGALCCVDAVHRCREA